LQSFTTNDVKRLSPSQGCEAFVTSPQGKTLAHILIFCKTNQHVLDTTPAQAATIIEHFNRYVITEDVVFADKTADYADLLVAGPKAESLLSSLVGEKVPSELLCHAAFNIAGQPVTIRRVEYAGTNSYFLQVGASNVEAVSQTLQQAGAIRCGHPAIDSARLESGVPLFGIDITPENLPQEVNRDAKAISFTKGCYLGQETVARIDAIGHVNRLLVGLKFSNDSTISPAGAALLAAAQPVGHVTSAAWSPRLKAPLALAYVRRNQAKPGCELESTHGPAAVVALPLAASA
jgi:tRNA-modifying protein YgfZ